MLTGSKNLAKLWIAAVVLSTYEKGVNSLVPYTLRGNNGVKVQNATNFTNLSHEGSCNDQLEVKKETRELESRALYLPMNYYHVITSFDELGEPNPHATIGNPMRGLTPSPRYLPPSHWENNPLNPSMEFYYVGLDELIIENEDSVGKEMAYNWTALELLLQDTATRYAHAVVRVIIHFPGEPLRLPQFLTNIDMRWVQIGKGPSTELTPYYGDLRLLRALQLFLTEFGAKFDGDKRIAAIQLGLVGFWGEWHVCCNNDDENVLPDFVREQMIDWYANAFTKTKLQMRYANPHSGYERRIGRHDDSFGKTTMNGPEYYFWPQTVNAHQDDFWMWGMMGGETRPELQSSIFENWFQPNGEHQQDFMACVETTHATYMFHHNAFIDGGYQGDELENALYAHARMGYRFRIVKVAAAAYNDRSDTIRIDVDVAQKGVAPFYYPLSLTIECPTLSEVRSVSGVENLIHDGQEAMFSFDNIPNDPTCLSNIKFGLSSPNLYNERPIKFSQGNTGIVSVSIPVSIPSTEIVPVPIRDKDSLPNYCTDEHRCDDGYIMSVVVNGECQQYCVGVTCAKLLQLVSWKCGSCY
jgi:hypothetical protein